MTCVKLTARLPGTLRATVRPRTTLLLAALALLAAGGCGPQEEDEVAVTFRAGFKLAVGASAEVVYPFPSDALADAIAAGLTVSSGGSAEVRETPEGRGLWLSGSGEVFATFSANKLEGLGKDKGIPQVAITRAVPGESTFYVRVTGPSSAPVDFAYEVSKDCGMECGGERKFRYQGPAALGLNKVTVTVSEAARK